MTSTHFTTPEATEARTVKIAEFRQVIEHLETKIHRDFHSCVGRKEQENWAWSTRRIVNELSVLVCKRATADDMQRRERALDRCASMLIQHSL